MLARIHIKKPAYWVDKRHGKGGPDTRDFGKPKNKNAVKESFWDLKTLFRRKLLERSLPSSTSLLKVFFGIQKELWEAKRDDCKSGVSPQVSS